MRIDENIGYIVRGTITTLPQKQIYKNYLNFRIESPITIKQK